MVIEDFHFKKKKFNKNIRMTTFYDEVEIEDFEFDEELEIYTYPCPCGDKFVISQVCIIIKLKLTIFI